MTIVNGVVNGVANGAASANGSRIEEAAHDGHFTCAVSVHHKVSLDEGLSLDKECSNFFSACHVISRFGTSAPDFQADF